MPPLFRATRRERYAMLALSAMMLMMPPLLPRYCRCRRCYAYALHHDVSALERAFYATIDVSLPLCRCLMLPLLPEWRYMLTLLLICFFTFSLMMPRLIADALFATICARRDADMRHDGFS